MPIQVYTHFNTDVDQLMLCVERVEACCKVSAKIQEFNNAGHLPLERVGYHTWQLYTVMYTGEAKGHKGALPPPPPPPRWSESKQKRVRDWS